MDENQPLIFRPAISVKRCERWTIYRKEGFGTADAEIIEDSGPPLEERMADEPENEVLKLIDHYSRYPLIF